MAQRVEWDGVTIALLVDGIEGRYLVPPIVFGHNGELLMGREVLLAIAEAGMNVDVPVFRNCTPAMLADLEQQLARVSEQLDAPISTN